MSRPCRVLIADDNRDIADSLAVLLQMDGHHVTIVDDGAAAIRAIDNAPPDVALLDVGMPGMNGYEVARQARAQLKNSIVLVAITGYGQPKDKILAVAAGFDHHFTKPVEPTLVAALLQEISASRA
jgi:CheY-like chemotaxis protein